MSKDRLTLLADCAYFCDEAIRKIELLADMEREEVTVHDWLQARSLLCNVRSLCRLEANEQRRRRRVKEILR